MKVLNNTSGVNTKEFEITFGLGWTFLYIKV